VTRNFYEDIPVRRLPDSKHDHYAPRHAKCDIF
jgi:hypothetical protein